MSNFSTTEGPCALPEHHHGPWSVPPTPTPEAKTRWRPSRGLIIWLGLLAAAVAAYFGLLFLFPGQIDGMDQTNALQALGLLALVSSGVVYARGIKLGEAARNAAIWVGIAAIALIGYSFRTELSDAFVKVRGEVIPAYAISTTPHEMTVTRSADGGFYILGQINGAPVRFVIDTGANGVLLSPDDAKRAGMDVDTLKYASPAETANGVGFMAPIILPQLEVGEMKLASVQAAVNKAPMSSSLLGMAFLRQLDSVEIHGDTLTLKWKSQAPATPLPVPASPPAGSPRTA
ncbi:MAG: TIGR02281 family clan AA aspartic protease [Caulobacteraceae bacterium]